MKINTSHTGSKHTAETLAGSEKKTYERIEIINQSEGPCKLLHLLLHINGRFLVVVIAEWNSGFSRATAQRNVPDWVV